ncbi:MAG: hypothetical protein WCL36_07345 [bacterium]|jgi:hypothetical protein
MTQSTRVNEVLEVPAKVRWQRALIGGTLWGVAMWYFTSAMNVVVLGRPFMKNAMIALPAWMLLGVITDRAISWLQGRIRARTDAKSLARECVACARGGRIEGA